MLLNTLGQRLRARRKELQYSQAKVAKKSGVSLRFLADVEMGRSNISVLRLAEICAALQIPLAELLRGLGSNGAQMLSLVGMRGGGKSTIGRALAADLQVTFLELDQLIAEQAQMPLSEIFSMGGMALYREYESTTLQKLFESGKPIILGNRWLTGTRRPKLVSATRVFKNSLVALRTRSILGACSRARGLEADAGVL